MTGSKVLILTELDTDPHAQAVKKALENLGESVVVIDPGLLPQSGRVSLELSETTTRRQLALAEETIDLETVKSCWYRRPSTPQITQNLHSDYKQVVRDEWRAFINALWESMDTSLWVSPPHAIRRAELKPLQLSTARKLGFNIPATIFTNDVDEAYGFYQNHGSRIIAKKIFSHGVAHEDGAALFASCLLEGFSKSEFRDLALCPCIFQQYVPKVADLRITIIGSDVFAVSIESRGDVAANIDYRVAEGGILSLRHARYDLPEGIENKCRLLVQALGLTFGAVDLILQPNGKHVFLEVNPNGQWLWLELLAGLPMVDSMASLLASGRSPYEVLITSESALP